MKNKLFNIRTKNDLREYFVLTLVLGIGMFITIFLFSVSFYYQLKSHQKNLDLRSLRVQEHIQLTLSQHNLILKYIDRKIKFSDKTKHSSLLQIADDFLQSTLFEAIDIVSIDTKSDQEKPNLVLINSDSRVPNEKGLIFENFRKSMDEYQIPIMGGQKTFVFVYSPGKNKKWYFGMARFVENDRNEFLIAWIPLESSLPKILFDEHALSVMISNTKFVSMPALKLDSQDGQYHYASIQSLADFKKDELYVEHRILDANFRASNILVGYLSNEDESYGWSWIVLCTGMLISVLISLLVFNLINRNIEVNQLVDEKTLDVIKASKQAMKANEVKTRFLANISHEVRTPLNIILGMSDLLMETELSNDQKKYVDTFRRSGTHLLDLINDVIDIIRLEADETTFENKDFSLSEVIQEVSSFCALNAQNKKIEFSYSLSPELPSLVSGDPRRLKQILLNLVNNSIKFTDGGFVRLHVLIASTRAGTSQIRFIVEDSGIGISDEDKDKIFEAFTQVDPSSTRNKGGVGLGLSIVKTLISKLHGTIQLDSKVEMGSRFVVTLPYSVINGASWIENAVQPFKFFFADKKVALFSNENHELRMLSEVLKATGCQLSEYNSEYRFLEALRQPTDIFIVDFLSIHNNQTDFFDSIEKDCNKKTIFLVLLPLVQQQYDFSEIKKIPQVKIGYRPLMLSNLLQNVTQEQTRPAEPILVDGVGHSFNKDLKALIVEDDLENRLLMKAYLKNAKFNTYFAASGTEGLQMFKSVRPHVVITDIQMPEMDGFKLTALIRSYESENDLPPSIIYALSADALPEHRQMARDVGIDKYLTKPITKTVFIDNLHEAEKLYNESLRFLGAAGSSSGAVTRLVAD